MQVNEDDLGRYPHPHLTVDVALVTLQAGALHALLLRRREAPARGAMALPGGFVRVDESLPDAASRVLRDKVNLRDVFLEQLFTFGDVRRDPRGRVVTVAYYALVPEARLAAVAGDGNLRLLRLDVPWPDTDGGEVAVVEPDGKRPALAFDHAAILGTVVQRLRGKIDYAPVGFELLPERFTLLQLLQVHEAVLGRELNKDSFRRRMLASGLVAATGKLQSDVDHRPAELFRFVAARPRPRPEDQTEVNHE